MPSLAFLGSREYLCRFGCRVLPGVGGRGRPWW